MQLDFRRGRASRCPADHGSGHHRRPAQILRLLFTGRVRLAVAAPPIFRPTVRWRCATLCRDTQGPGIPADAQKLQIDVNPISAEAVERLIGELYAAPEPALAKLRTMLAQ